ncbi:MAG: hypothetical protein JNL70_25925 [Saprospiraceae bacterium]|nr:hypothetical protein [Saprospiraceae bacterium]
MQSTNFIQRAVKAAFVFALSSTTLLAQIGPGNGGNTPAPNTGGPQPDFEITSFTLDNGSTTVVRETMINGTVKLKNKGGATQKTDKVMLKYIPDETAYQKDPSKNFFSYGPIEFNAQNEAEVHVSFGGFSTAGTYSSKVIVNPESTVAEKSYINNSKSLSITAKPHTVDVDFKFEQVTVTDDMELTGDSELRMKLKVGKKSASGTITWLAEEWWPTAPDPENKKKDFVEVTDNGGAGRAYSIGKIIKLNNLSDEDYIVYETQGWEDEDNTNDLLHMDNEDMGKANNQLYQIKTWANPIGVNSGAGRTDKSNKDTYSVKISAKITELQ